MKIKVLFLDLLCPKGHVKINEYMIHAIESLPKVIGVDVAVFEGYLNENLYTEKCKFKYLPKKFFRHNVKTMYRIENIRKLYWSNKNLDFSKYDLVYISSFETISFSIYSRFENLGNNIIIFNHNNITELMNPIKWFFYKNINKQIMLGVYNNDIKTYIQKEYGIKNNIYSIHHPIVHELNNRKKTKKNVMNIFAPSSSNTLTNIEDLIKCFNSVEKLKVYIKDSNIERKSGNVTISSNWLTNNQYESLFQNATVIMLLFDKTFTFRESGVFFEAMAQKKFVLTNSKYIRDTYFNKYPKIGMYIDENNYMNSEIKKVLEFDSYDDTGFESIIKDHSLEVITNELDELLAR